MFSGLVQAIGTVHSIQEHRFGFRWPGVSNSYSIGESISINGCCLTVVESNDDVFYADLVDETLIRTTMSHLKIGDFVNLERAMTVGDAIGGHFVQGHIDCVGTVVHESPNLQVSFDKTYGMLVVEKGSIAIDGVSLTVVKALSDQLEVAIIPHTNEVTTLGKKQIGQLVNLEFDMLAKHVTRVLEAHLARLVIPPSY